MLLTPTTNPKFSEEGVLNLSGGSWRRTTPEHPTYVQRSSSSPEASPALPLPGTDLLHSQVCLEFPIILREVYKRSNGLTSTVIPHAAFRTRSDKLGRKSALLAAIASVLVGPAPHLRARRPIVARLTRMTAPVILRISEDASSMRKCGDVKKALTSRIRASKDTFPPWLRILNENLEISIYLYRKLGPNNVSETLESAHLRNGTLISFPVTMGHHTLRASTGEITMHDVPLKFLQVHYFSDTSDDITCTSQGSQFRPLLTSARLSPI
ncbi:hypothetical protein BDZ89DRAFT_1197943 [Hymenopellis radicata]|nr:hypothetical protein BDZ89DRAFT_1197943 [Hymenopellis radicata]